MSGLAEALSLGLASGPVCIGSCGPVLLPWLAAESAGLRGTARLLGSFLGGRLAGYLCFAALAWTAGLAIPVEPHSRALLLGLVNLGLAVVLAWHAWSPWRRPRTGRQQAGQELYGIKAKPRFRPPAALSLGFLTGLNLCPPFLVAGVRAAETRSLPAAMLFFLVFFAGAAVWFLPALAVSSLRRIAVAGTVARMIMLLLAAYYAYLGFISLYWRLAHD
jgi:sulfite exporter TauE/SafE